MSQGKKSFGGIKRSFFLAGVVDARPVLLNAVLDHKEKDGGKDADEEREEKQEPGRPF